MVVPSAKELRHVVVQSTPAGCEVTRPAPPPANKWNAASSTDDDEEDEEVEVDENGKTYRVDGPPAEMLKGLSKRQKRAVQQQWREQQRSQKGR